MQPRQIYASTLSRRERRWTRRRARGAGIALVMAATFVAALSVVAVVVPGMA